MGIHEYGVALFFHVGFVIVGFMIAAVLHASLHVLIRTDNVAQMKPFAKLVHRLEPFLPFTALLILIFGAWLIHLTHGGIKWGDGWVLTALITLIAVEGLAGALLAPRTKKLVAAIEATPDGPVPAELRAAARNPIIWDIAHIASGSFLGVVFVMVDKPTGGGAVLLVAIGTALGVALSRFQLSKAPA